MILLLSAHEEECTKNTEKPSTKNAGLASVQYGRGEDDLDRYFNMA